MRTRLVVPVVSLALVAGLLLSVPASAHKSLRKGKYECWLSQITQYSYFDLKIKTGGKYVWVRSDGKDPKNGNFVHDGKKIRFKSGYLKKQGFKGKHLVYKDSFGDLVHTIYLYKGGYDADDLKYDCSNR